ncbi:hypothetical protein Vi05172_g6194 [Venturia inaequalis]|uniref:DUF6590 domain-containing protein n=1 Tax=Venturia inaequalis TaxID=5025 RepID=A0A8H3VW17_VENIN|nr:hypothetical protein EG327_000072 [Venturia inaequalis]RDI83729.1 hypothetical protein Vi05172_g6194 [Venturia inaequalis]
MASAWSTWTPNPNGGPYYRYRLDERGVAEYQNWTGEPSVETPRSSEDTQFSGSNQSPEQAQPAQQLYQTSTADSNYTTAAQTYNQTYGQNYTGHTYNQGYAAPTYNQHYVTTGHTPATSAYDSNYTAPLSPYGQVGTSSGQASYQAPSSYNPQQGTLNASPQTSLSRQPSGSAAQVTLAASTLDREFQVLNTGRDRKRFFFVGRVFATLWVQVAGAQAPETDGVSVIRYNERAPISSYKDNGVKNRHDARHHSVAYSTDEPPALLPGEFISKNAIQIRLSQGATPGVHLKPTSRVNFSRTSTVDHNVKVKKIGVLTETGLAWADSYWRNYMREN